MPTFEYQAQQADGSSVKGLIVGSSLDAAAGQLVAKGLTVTQIGFAAVHDPIPAGFTAPKPSAERPAAAPSSQPYDYSGRQPETEEVPAEYQQRSYVDTSVVGPLVGKVPLDKLGFFFRQAGTMLNAGVPIVQSLNTLASQARDPKLETVLRELSRAVEQGHQMSVVLQRYPEVFTPVMLSVVRAGEEGGFLDQALGTVADYIDQEIELRNLYKKATFWPKLELALSILIVMAANAIIGSMGQKGAQTIDAPLNHISTWMWLGPLIVIGFLFFRVGLANPAIKAEWDRFGNTLPFLGKTLQQIAMARFGRAFAALYKAGVPLKKSMMLSADACGNEYLRAKMYPAFRNLDSGAGITDTMVSTNAFSPIVLDMVRTGETTGNLDHMLNKVSEFYIEDAKVRQIQLGYVVGVAVFLCTAIYIGYVVISFYTGYFSGVSQAVNGS